jgi:hypothetical protein
MRWATRQPRDTKQWARWFAWRPIRVGTEWVWLEYVDRREHFRFDQITSEYRDAAPDSATEGT